MRKLALLLGLFALLGGLAISDDTSAGSKTIHVLVFKENGIGSAAQAQPYVDKLIQVTAKANGWSSAKGKYLTRRRTAKKYIKKYDPHYGIMSLGAFLRMRKRHKLAVVGEALIARAGGRRYHIISKDASSLSKCKGKKLASNHAKDKKFINKVVAGGAFKLSDFDVVKTRRPVQTIKAVIKGKAYCALVDDAQLAELPHIHGADGIAAVWGSKELPPMAVVAFSSAPDAERAKFKATLGSICTGAGKESCDKVGIQAFKASDKSAYAKVIKAYDG